jgi:hypothetical protein
MLLTGRRMLHLVPPELAHLLRPPHPTPPQQTPTSHPSPPPSTSTCLPQKHSEEWSRALQEGGAGGAQEEGAGGRGMGVGEEKERGAEGGRGSGRGGAEEEGAGGRRGGVEEEETGGEGSGVWSVVLCARDDVCVEEVRALIAP